jgi:MFS family permease
MEAPAEDRKGITRRRDLSCGATGLLIWLLPIAILAVTAGLGGGAFRAVTWPVLLTLMGAACLLNARRCGRLHCFITGPFFLLLAALSLLYGLGIAPLGPHGWQWLLNILLIGGCFLTWVPEWLFGKYVRHF